MTTCADIIPYLLSDAVGNQLSSEGMLSSCVQAAGTVMAAAKQAKAARDAGHWAGFAGVAVVGAALLTVWGVKINASREDQRARLERALNVKQAAYSSVADMAVAGVMQVPRIGDFDRSPKDDQEAFQVLVSRIGRAYIVSELTTLSLILDAVASINALHSQIWVSRLQIQKRFPDNVPPEDRLRLLQVCMQAIPKLHPPLANALAAMRRELGFPAEAAAIQEVMTDASKRAQEIVAQMIKDVTSLIDNTPAS